MNQKSSVAQADDKNKGTSGASDGTFEVQQFAFQTEVRQLLDLMIHSLYSRKEVFLRELISNASDACDKLQFAALTDNRLKQEAAAARIDVRFDAKARTLSVSDNGIGMSRDEVIDNIGTIARSGTRKFLSAMQSANAPPASATTAASSGTATSTAAPASPASSSASSSVPPSSSDASLIGQFGVGFYSVFMVADKVVLHTRRAGEAASAGVEWSSQGGDGFTLIPQPRAEHGCTVTLHLREGEEEFADEVRLHEIIRKYSDHISIPIHMPTRGDDAKADTKDDAKGDANADAKADAKADTKAKSETAADDDAPAKISTTTDTQIINQGAALWARPRKDISDKDYNEFYTALSFDAEPPAAVIHNRVEGNLEYISLFFIPARAPLGLMDPEQRHGVRLYVRRIFIMDDSRYLLPRYLRFVRGIIDAADLPLNVSREFLQQNKDIARISSACTRKILAELQRIAKQDDDVYDALWKQYGAVLKEGLVEDAVNLETLATLARFASTKSEGDAETVSLTAYIARMPVKQKVIYYLTAQTNDAAAQSPHLEIFRKNDVEVLLLSDAVDEWVVGHLREYQGKPLQSVARSGVDLKEIASEDVVVDVSGEKIARADDNEKTMAPLCEKLKASLDGKVKEVVISRRLTDSPACLIADAHDMGGNLKRILEAMGQELPVTLPVMEINAAHPLIRQLSPDSADLGEWAEILFSHAALSEGATLAQPAAYVRRVNELLTRALLKG